LNVFDVSLSVTAKKENKNMKNFLAAMMLFLCFAFVPNHAHAQGTRINPGSQIAWPTCSAGQAYFPTTNNCITPSTTAGVIDVTTQTGSDIGAKFNAAITTGGGCATQSCTLYVPPGSYSFSTTINLPLNTFGNLSVWLNPGAILSYTGSGTAINTYIGTSGPGPTNLHIMGGQLLGTSSGAEGIHILPSQRVTIEGMLIYGFTTGDGIWLEGPDSMTVQNNILQGNKNGLRVSPTFCTSSYPYTCSSTTSGTAWSPNLINVLNNQIAVNSQWGAFEDRNGVSGSGWTGSLGNHYENNDFEANGSAGGTYGAIYVGKSTTVVISKNYFEASPREVVLGELGSGAFFAAVSPNVRDNYFTTLTTTPFNIELENTNGAILEGNAELVSTSNSSNCDINAATSGEINTYLSQNHWFLNGSSPAGNPLCINGSAANLLSGSGSFALQNSTFQTYIADGFYQTTSTGTSETITLSNIRSGSYCFITPADATAASFPFSSATFYVVPGSGMVTYFHPNAANGIRVNIWCSTT
jgi:hypothetical protein